MMLFQPKLHGFRDAVNCSWLMLKGTCNMFLVLPVIIQTSKSAFLDISDVVDFFSFFCLLTRARWCSILFFQTRISAYSFTASINFICGIFCFISYIWNTWLSCVFQLLFLPSIHWLWISRHFYLTWGTFPVLFFLFVESSILLVI